MDAFPTPARRATASTLKPDQPTSPNSRTAASATRSSTPGSRGRPGTAAAEGLLMARPSQDDGERARRRVLLNGLRQYSVAIDITDGKRLGNPAGRRRRSGDELEPRGDPGVRRVGGRRGGGALG